MINVDNILESFGDEVKGVQNINVAKRTINALKEIARASSAFDKYGETVNPQERQAMFRTGQNNLKQLINSKDVRGFYIFDKRQRDLFQEIATETISLRPGDEQGRELTKDCINQIKNLRTRFNLRADTDLVKDFSGGENRAGLDHVKQEKYRAQLSDKNMDGFGLEYKRMQRATKVANGNRISRLKDYDTTINHGERVSEIDKAAANKKINVSNKITDAAFKNASQTAGENLQEFEDVFPGNKNLLSLLVSWANSNIPADEAHKVRVKKIPNQKVFIGEINGKKFRLKAGQWNNSDRAADGRFKKPAALLIATKNDSPSYDPRLAKYIEL